MNPILQKMRHLVDRLRRKLAYVPSVSNTVQSLKNIGVDLTDKK